MRRSHGTHGHGGRHQLRVGRRPLLLVGVALVAVALSILVALMFGPYGPLDALPAVKAEGRDVGVSEFIYTLLGGGTDDHRAALLDVRLPRVLMAVLAGGTLAIAGATMQTVFRNPLADPFILGVSAGAALGAALNIILGIGYAYGLLLPMMAFAGGLLAALTAYLIARRAGVFMADTLLLAGIALNSLLSALLLSLLFFSAEQFRSLFFWLLGGLDRANWNSIRIVLAVYAAGGLYALFRARAMNLLMLGDEQAKSLGVEVEVEKRRLVIVATLLTATTVAFTGIIGYVGLIIPHAVRLVLGPDNRLLLPVSAVVGGVFLVWADLLARSVLSIGELPVGVVTAACGAPFFLYLLVARRQSGPL